MLGVSCGERAGSPVVADLLPPPPLFGEGHIHLRNRTPRPPADSCSSARRPPTHRRRPLHSTSAAAQELPPAPLRRPRREEGGEEGRLRIWTASVGSTFSALSISHLHCDFVAMGHKSILGFMCDDVGFAISSFPVMAFTFFSFYSLFHVHLGEERPCGGAASGKRRCAKRIEPPHLCPCRFLRSRLGKVGIRGKKMVASIFSVDTGLSLLKSCTQNCANLSL